jgi:hypothetical protein
MTISRGISRNLSFFNYIPQRRISLQPVRDIQSEKIFLFSGHSDHLICDHKSLHGPNVFSLVRLLRLCIVILLSKHTTLNILNFIYEINRYRMFLQYRIECLIPIHI